MRGIHTFVVDFSPDYDGDGKLLKQRDAVTVEAFEMDVVDGVLVFSGINRGGYVACFARGEWVRAVGKEEE